MVTQYDKTGIAKEAGESTKVNGRWSEEDTDVILETKCRVETARSNQYIVGADGKQITISSIIYMPRTSVDIKAGTLFEVWDGEKLILSDTVKQFWLGQLNARIWL